MILATNDDGVSSPGLVAVRDALAPLDEVVVVAPATDRSGRGAVPGEGRIRVERVELADGSAALAVDGGPADCVRIGASGALGAPPRLVVSGINLGVNVGAALSVSGTFAAALQAAMLGVPAMAVSQERPRRGGGHWDFRAAKDATVRLAEALLELYPAGLALNVNVPGLPPEEVRGMCLTTVARPLAGGPAPDGAGPGHLTISDYADAATDVAALARGEVSVSPVRVEPAEVPFPAGMVNRPKPGA